MDTDNKHYKNHARDSVESGAKHIISPEIVAKLSDPGVNRLARSDLARSDLARSDLARSDLPRSDLARSGQTSTKGACCSHAPRSGFLPLYSARPMEVSRLIIAGVDELVPRCLVAGDDHRELATKSSQLIYSADRTQNLWTRRLGDCREELKQCGDADALSAFLMTEIYLDFLRTVVKRSGLDGRGTPVVSSVHYGRDYGNAFYDGKMMVYGDGDGRVFSGFTRDFTVIAHELSHGFSNSLCAMNYTGQPGALNESLSDVFACVAEQWRLRQTVREANWLIGQSIMAKGYALRSLAAPGRAYVGHPVIQTDPQVDHMSKYVVAERDGGGVHLNSGIPNKAFYLFARSLGGHAWEQAFWVWYGALTPKLLNPSVTFREFAGATIEVGGEKMEKKLRDAWRAVGVL